MKFDRLTQPNAIHLMSGHFRSKLFCICSSKVWMRNRKKSSFLFFLDIESVTFVDTNISVVLFFCCVYLKNFMEFQWFWKFTRNLPVKHRKMHWLFGKYFLMGSTSQTQMEKHSRKKMLIMCSWATRSHFNFVSFL